MERQTIVVCKLSEEENAAVNAKKRSKENFWTHKVVCGEHVTFLTVGQRIDLAEQVIELWPMAFSGIGKDLHPNAKTVEQADRRYLITLEEKFGDPTKRKLKECEQSLREHGINISLTKDSESNFRKKKGLLARLFGG